MMKKFVIEGRRHERIGGMPCERLLQEHLKIRLLGADLIESVSSPTACDPDLLAKKRWNLARMVHQHLAYEDRQLFHRLVVDPRADVRNAALLGKRAIEQLHVSYKAHVERWTGPEIVAHWQEFREAVTVMVRRTMYRLDREEQDLFPFLAHVEEALPRWQPGARNWAGDGVAMQPLIRGIGSTR